MVGNTATEEVKETEEVVPIGQVCHFVGPRGCSLSLLNRQKSPTTSIQIFSGVSYDDRKAFAAVRGKVTTSFRIS